MQFTLLQTFWYSSTASVIIHGPKISGAMLYKSYYSVTKNTERIRERLEPTTPH